MRNPGKNQFTSSGISYKADGLGSQAQFCESMSMPLKFMQRFWEEEKKEKILEDLLDALLVEITKETGGEDKLMYMQMSGIVGTGRKPQ